MTSASPNPPDAEAVAVPVRGSVLFLAGICLVASIGGLLFGFDTAVISGTVEFVRSTIRLDRFRCRVGSPVRRCVGCILGAAVAGVSGRPLRPQADSDRRRDFLLRLRAVLDDSADVHDADAGADRSAAWAWAWPRCWRRCTSASSRRRISGAGWWPVFQLSIVIGILAAYFSNWCLVGYATEPSVGVRREGTAAPDPGRRSVARHVRRGDGSRRAVLSAAVLRAGKPALAGQGTAARTARSAILARVAGRDTARRQMAEIQAVAGPRNRLVRRTLPAGAAHGAAGGRDAVGLRPALRREHRRLLRPEDPQGRRLSRMSPRCWAKWVSV